MEVMLKSTNDVVQWRGIDYQVWNGHTAGGIPVRAMLVYIECTDREQQRNYENELRLTGSLRLPIPRGIPNTDTPIIGEQVNKWDQD